MRRHLPPSVAALAALAVAPVLVVLPTMSLPAAPAHPVKSTLTSLPISGVDSTALSQLQRPAATTRPLAPGTASSSVTSALERTPAVLTAQKSTTPFTLVALTWNGATPAGTTMQVRVRQQGTWTGWEQLGTPDDGPDVGSSEAKAVHPLQSGVSDPLLTDGADGVQVRVDTATGTAPSGLHVQLIDAGQSAADAPSQPAATAAADTGQPTIVTRAQWGADESLVKNPPAINPTVKALFLHHTDTTNTYTQAQAYAQVRAVYVFHTKVRGWNDIGYNFVVDKYGQVFEGRKGSLTAAIQGAHTAGFNENTLGISALGTFSTTAPTSAMVKGIVDVMSWKAAVYGIDPRTTTQLTATDGSNKYAAGKTVAMPTIAGHRDGYLTECPGNDLYPLLGSIRSAIASRMAPGVLNPTLSTTQTSVGGSAVTFSAVFPTWQQWSLSLTPMCGSPSPVFSGRATGRVQASWGLNGPGGAPVTPGVYRLTATASSPVGAAPAWNRDVEVLPTPGSPPAACPVARLATPDLFAGSVIAGRSAYPDAKSVVVVGSGGRLDAILAAPLSRTKQAPLLMTAPGALPQVVAQDITSRGVTDAWIVGSTTAVSAAVEAQLHQLGVANVVRLTGSDRYASAAAVAGAVGPNPSAAAVVVSGDNTRLWDAIAAAGPAAGTNRPLLLVNSLGVPPVTGAALKALGVHNVAVVADARAVPNAVIAKLAASGVTSRFRITGADRYATALAVDTTFSKAVPADRVIVAPASDAGMAWATLAAAQGRLTVLTDPDAVPASSAAWLTARKPGSVALVADPASASVAVIRQVYTITR